jgi:hypothetical protein
VQRSSWQSAGSSGNYRLVADWKDKIEARIGLPQFRRRSDTRASEGSPAALFHAFTVGIFFVLINDQRTFVCSDPVGYRLGQVLNHVLNQIDALQF